MGIKMEQVEKLVNRVLSNLGRISYAIVRQRDKSVVLDFDVITECTTSGSAVATKYPTEYGQSATNYKYASPDTVAMTGIISLGGAFNAGFGINGNVITDAADRKTLVENIRRQCKELVSTLSLLTVQTRNSGLWENMTLIQYTIDETVDNFSQLVVQMDFQQVPQFTTGGKFVSNPADEQTINLGQTLTQIFTA